MVNPTILPSDDLAVVELRDATLRVDQTDILHDVTLQISHNQFWVVLGKNGAGKTSLLRLCGAQRVPSSGHVSILGETSGRTDLRILRANIAFVSQAIEDRVDPQLTPLDIVLARKDGSLVPWFREYSDADRARAERLLTLVELHANHATRRFATLSTGERMRTMLARALMPGARLMLRLRVPLGREPDGIHHLST